MMFKIVTYISSCYNFLSLVGFFQLGFPGGSDGKEFTAMQATQSLIPGCRYSAGERNCYPLRYSCLENSKDRGHWQATVHGVAKSLTQLRDEHISSVCGRLY